MKKIKFFTCIAALGLVLSLGACDVSSLFSSSDSSLDEEDTSGDEDIEPSESGNTSDSTETGDTSDSKETPGEGGETGDSSGGGGDTGSGEYQPTLTNYTLSIAIMYNNQKQILDETYAHAFIQGGWDEWASWIELKEVDGEYQHTFDSIDVGSYQYQLVLDYDDTNVGYTYRITQDGANASFSVTGYEGDGYINHVEVEAQKSVEDILPDPSKAIEDVTVTIDITLNSVSQDALTYATLWIEGSWDWNAGFTACTLDESGHYVAKFDSLAPIDYEFLGVIYYSDESLPTDDTVWNYKVNGDNCKFTVDTNNVTAELVATKALSSILPPKTSGEETTGGFTLRFTITYGGAIQTVPSYAEIYYAGASNNWGFDKLTANGSSYELTATDTITAGTKYEYGLLMDFTNDTSHLSGWTYKVNSGSGNLDFTPSATDLEAGYIELSVVAKDALSNIIVEGAATNVTFQFTVTSKTVPSGSKVYMIGSMNNDNWTTWLECTNTSGNIWTYTFSSLDLGGIEYKVVFGSNTPVAGSWSWGQTEITGANVSLTVTSSMSNTTLSYTI